MRTAILGGLAALALGFGCGKDNSEVKDVAEPAGTRAQEYDSGWQREETGWGWYMDKRVQSNNSRITLSTNMLDENGVAQIEHQWNIYFNPDGACEKEITDGAIIASDGFSGVGTHPLIDMGCNGTLDTYVIELWTPRRNTEMLNYYTEWIEGLCNLKLQNIKEEWQARAAQEGNHSYDTGIQPLIVAGRYEVGFRVQSNDSQITVNCDNWEWRAYAAQDGSCGRELFLHAGIFELPFGEEAETEDFVLDQGCDGSGDDASFSHGSWAEMQQEFARKREMFDKDYNFEEQIQAWRERGY